MPAAVAHRTYAAKLHRLICVLGHKVNSQKSAGLQHGYAQTRTVCAVKGAVGAQHAAMSQLAGGLRGTIHKIAIAQIIRRIAAPAVAAVAVGLEPQTQGKIICAQGAAGQGDFVLGALPGGIVKIKGDAAVVRGRFGAAGAQGVLIRKSENYSRIHQTPPSYKL